MNKTVENIYRSKMIRSIIKNIAKDPSEEDLRDLEQDICLTLLEKPEEILQGIWERKQMGYYLSRIVMNNINSKTSRFYYMYKKNKEKEIPLDNANTNQGEREPYDRD